jgi:heme exporter protein A
VAAVIEANFVSKSFGRQPVLCDLNFTIDKGEIVAIMGANGAGKTTLLRILATLTRPDKGLVTIFGLPIKGNEKAICKKIGVSLHAAMLYADLTAEENLSFFAHLYQVKNPDERLEEIFSEIRISNQRKKIVRNLSRGMQQRLAIGRALLNRPDLLLLDEPFTGMDLDSVENLEQLIRGVGANGGTVVYVSHDFERVTHLSGKAWFLQRGKMDPPVALEGMSASQLQSRYQSSIEKIK